MTNFSVTVMIYILLVISFAESCVCTNIFSAVNHHKFFSNTLLNMKLIYSPFSYGPWKPVGLPQSVPFNVVKNREDMVAADIMAGVMAAIWAAQVKLKLYSDMFPIYTSHMHLCNSLN